ncbi:MAG TPA: ribosome biogenesis GTP-binding protein YihA/YsxC [Nevskiaceae bacterium]|nr:ribosome biogenesis GTP-binding protein YihA/YsxC [Nevskiaceae bacterium]
MTPKPEGPAPAASAPRRNPLAQTRFLLSCAQLTQLPRDGQPEVAFAGRSNAGKSSALNALCGQRQLARVSKTPGRTQLINLFAVGAEDSPRLADLPGYGYAAVPEAVRRGWGALIGGYVETRATLQGLVVIMDIRHPLTDHDRQLLSWARDARRPCHVLLTKADKLGFGAAKNQLLATRRELEAQNLEARVQLFSAHAPQGLDEARERVAGWLGMSPAA